MNNYPYQQLSLFQQPTPQQPTYPQPNYQQTYQPSTTPATQGIVWVSSEDYVYQYPVAPGGTVYFMNENEPYFYAKSADMMGKPTVKKSRLLDESEPEKDKVNLSEYIKREEIEDIISNTVQKEVERRINEISFKPTRKQKVVEVEE